MSSQSSSFASTSVSSLKFQVSVSGLLDGQETSWENARDVAVDKLGNVYVVGGTTSSNFPVTLGGPYVGGGVDVGSIGDSQVFITKLDSFGKIIWSRFLGGPNHDRAYAVEVDDNFNVYVAGRAGPGFPTTTGVVQPNFGGDVAPNSAYGKQDGFITKISPDGSTLIWSTYFGDSSLGIVRDIDVDPMGIVHVAAWAERPDMNVYVTANALQSTRRGNSDSFYARISADGSRVIYGTWLGGNDTGSRYSPNPAVRALPDGSAYFLTTDPAAGAPITSGMRNYSGGFDFILTKIDAAGNTQFCTYIGGSGDEAMDTHSLALLPNGNAVVAAGSNSANYPVTDGSSLQGGIDLTVTVFSGSGAIVNSTILGGAGSFDIAEGVSTDSKGNIYLSGATASANLPVTANAIKSTSANSREGLMVILNQDLSQKQFVSYDNIIGEYANRSSVVDKFDRWHIVGAVWQMNPFPATLGMDGNINGLHAAFYRTLDVASSTPTNLPAKPTKISSGAALKIAVVGASTSACKNLVEGGYSLSDCWVNRLETYLQSVRPGSSVVNLAVSGTGTCHGLPTNGTVPAACPNPDNSANPKAIPLTTNNITQALSSNPDLVIVNYPHDYQIGVDPTIQNLLLIQAAANAAQVPVWFTTSQPAYADQASVNSRIQQRDRVQITFGDRAIDFWNPLVDPQGDGTMSANYVNHYDDNHPNAEGHRLLFESVKQRIGL